MKENGFTLIELLAVIVILAIIALIATPIILNIIKDSKEESNKRSIDMYAKALENSIAKYQLNGTKLEVNSLKPILEKKGREFEGTNLKVEYDGNVVCNTIKIYEEGNIFLSNCKVNDQEVEYTYGVEKFDVGMFDSICEIASDSPTTSYEIGSKYNCRVNPNKEPYTFYVLSYNDKNDAITNDKTEAVSINLIMNQNINSDGTPAGTNKVSKETNPNQYNLVFWNNEEGQGTTAYGPVTALKFLSKATSKWTNIKPLNFEYRDKEFINQTLYGYDYMLVSDGILTISGNQIEIESLLRARMPIYSTKLKEVASKNNTNQFLYENLSNDEAGYWVLSSYCCNHYMSWIVYLRQSEGYMLDNSFKNPNTGVRPVITLQL